MFFSALADYLTGPRSTQFLPVLGRVIADRLENKLDGELKELFSFTRPRSGEHVERYGESFQLVEEGLTTAADLKSTV